MELEPTPAPFWLPIGTEGGVGGATLLGSTAAVFRVKSYAYSFRRDVPAIVNGRRSGTASSQPGCPLTTNNAS